MDDLSKMCHIKHSVDRGIGMGPTKDPSMLKLVYFVFGKTVICIDVCVRLLFTFFFLALHILRLS